VILLISLRLARLRARIGWKRPLQGTPRMRSGTPIRAYGGPTGGATPFLRYGNDPIFTFIPVNDETNAQLLLKPVPAETFYMLYQQGWRVDQLVRLMVDRIELTRSSAKELHCRNYQKYASDGLSQIGWHTRH